VGFYRTFYRILKAGDLHGTSSLLSLFPELDFGVIFMTNSGDENSTMARDVIVSYATDLMFGIPPLISNLSVGCNFPCSIHPDAPFCRHTDAGVKAVKKEKTEKAEKTKKAVKAVAPKVKVTVQNPNQYVGLYHNPAYGLMNISYDMNSGNLTALYQYYMYSYLVPFMDTVDSFHYALHHDHHSYIVFERSAERPNQMFGLLFHFHRDVPYRIHFMYMNATVNDSFPEFGRMARGMHACAYPPEVGVKDMENMPFPFHTPEADYFPKSQFSAAIVLGYMTATIIGILISFCMFRGYCKLCNKKNIT